MSILSALKTKGAKGNNIEEAVKTLPIGGGSGDGAFFVTITMDGQGGFHSDKTFAEIKQAYDSKVPMYVRANNSFGGDGINELTVPCIRRKRHGVDADGEDKIIFQGLVDSDDDYQSISIATATIGVDYISGEPQEETIHVGFVGVATL